MKSIYFIASNDIKEKLLRDYKLIADKQRKQIGELKEELLKDHPAFNDLEITPLYLRNKFYGFGMIAPWKEQGYIECGKQWRYEQDVLSPLSKELGFVSFKESNEFGVYFIKFWANRKLGRFWLNKIKGPKVKTFSEFVISKTQAPMRDGFSNRNGQCFLQLTQAYMESDRIFIRIPWDEKEEIECPEGFTPIKEWEIQKLKEEYAEIKEEKND